MSREERKEGEMGSGVWISLPFWIGEKRGRRPERAEERGEGKWTDSGLREFEECFKIRTAGAAELSVSVSCCVTRPRGP